MFFLPLNDDKHTRFPFFTYLLILTNTAIFAFCYFTDSLRDVWNMYCSVPCLFPSIEWALRSITAMFTHSSWEHVLGNMFFLWAFGRRLEERLGGLRFVLFYVLAGVAGDFLTWTMHPHGTVGGIGASGAIAGVMGLCMMLMPWDKISLIVFVTVIPVLKIPLRCIFVCGIWFMLQWSMAWMPDAYKMGVGFWAHIGGFLAGVLLSIFTPRKPKVDNPALPPV